MGNKFLGVIGAVALLSAAGFATAQQATAQTTGSASPALEEVTVTGYRESVKRAQDLKRAAPSVVEAITLEDLGKFTDSSISDALQRVPGVQIQRKLSAIYNSPDSATIRGLTGSTTTLNGRSVLGVAGFLGEGLRNFDLSSVPPEILSGVTVFKTSTASQIEPGLAGQIDLQTLRPLDYAQHRAGQSFGSLSVSEGYGKGPKYSPRIGGIIGGKFLDGTLGLYVSGLFSRDKSLQDEYTSYGGGRHTVHIADASGGVTDIAKVRTFNGASNWEGNTLYEKKSFTTGLQWKPNNNVEINAEILSNKFHTERDDQSTYTDYSALTSQLDGATTRVNANSIALSGPVGNQFISYIDTSGATVGGSNINPLYTYSTHYYLRNKSDFDNYGFNSAFKSDDGNLKATFDYSRSEVTDKYHWITPYVPNIGTEATVDVRGSHPQYNIPASQTVLFGNPANYGAVSGYAVPTGFGGFDEDFEKQTKSKRDSVKLDFEAKLSDQVTLRSGMYYSLTDVTFVAMGTKIAPTDISGFFTGGTKKLGIFNAPLPEVSFAGFCRSNPTFCGQDNFGLGSFASFPSNSTGQPNDVLQFDQANSFKGREANTAIFAQANLQGHFFGMPYSGNAGVRVVRIDFSGTAIPGVTTRQKFDNDPIIPKTTPDPAITDTNQYWRTLPSLNLTLMPRANINLRFAAAKTISLADFRDLAPRGGALVFIDHSYNQFNLFSGGNSKLNPSTAWNYDVTGEYYTSYGGAYIASAFYKDVTDLLDTDILEGVTIPGLPGLFRSTTLVNRAKGNTSGFELSTNQPFTFLPAPWDGFGVQANYTYISSKITVRKGSTRFSGSSKYTINLTAYYEKNGWSARAALLQRPVVFLNRAYNPEGTSYDTVNPSRTTLDLSLSKKLSSHLDVIFTGSNVTSAPVSDRFEPYGVVENYTAVPAVYSLGVRASY